MILGIDVVFIHVKDPKKLARWYKKKLGLDFTFITPDLSWQECTFKTKEGTRFALDFQGENPSTVEKQRIMISFKVDDIQKSIANLEKKEVSFLGDKKILDVGTSFIATFQDPEGNYLQLSQRKKNPNFTSELS